MGAGDFSRVAPIWKVSYNKRNMSAILTAASIGRCRRVVHEGLTIPNYDDRDK